VAPALPGYPLSFQPGQRRLAIGDIADTFAALMDQLGYARFAAQGGDWGAFVTAALGHRFPDRVVGIHVTMLHVPRNLPPPAQPTEEERRYLEQRRRFAREEAGYQWIQGTKPQTLAYALADSPVGLAAWIVEKFRTWSDCEGDVERRFSKDVLLTNVMLYWVTGAINASFWPYYAIRHERWPLPDEGRIPVPAAYASFPCEILQPPRAWAERVYDLRRWTPMKAGGHFAALEEPQALAEDIRAFFRDLRE
jgi:microsomal epoxide hydrolase